MMRRASSAHSGAIAMVLGLLGLFDAPWAEAVIAPILQRPTAQREKQLRICNAYAHSGHMDVVLQRTRKSLGLLEYKACRDFALPLQDGDLLGFFVEGPKTPRLSVGGFALSEVMGAPRLPMLLTVQRRSQGSLRAAFQSHAFSAEVDDSAQVAVIDTTLGASDSTALRIAEVPKSVQQQQQQQQAVASGLLQQQQSQELLLNSASVVTPGHYRVSLEGQDDLGRAATLVAEPGASYVALRVGDPQDASGEFPEEVVVFPQPQAPQRTTFASLMSAASTWVRSWAAPAAAAS